MARRWQLILPLLAFMSTIAAKPTTVETLVVSRSEDEVTSSVAPMTEVTEESNPPIKLTEMDVQSKISLRYAHTAVVTHVRNPAKRAQETTFRMLLPDTAFISGFTMTIDGKAYKAYVKEKEEAKQIYSDAVSQGFGAAHIASKARDSNHFTVSVNVEPSSTVMFNLTYEELLVRRNGVYNHDINLHPGTLVPKMKVTVNIKESAAITVLRVPEIRTGNEVDAMENDPQNTMKVDIQKLNNDREAIITFTPDLNEQKRLMEVYAEKSKESFGNSHRYYPEDEEDKKDKIGVLGQFVVQYDVNRPEGGEVLVNDGYFVHFFAPKSLPPLPKHVVFVLDTSGSMMGRKIEQLRDAMQTILDKLNKHDYFSIVEFNSYVKVLDLDKADKPEPTTWRYSYFDKTPETTLVPPSPVTPGNIANAKIIISRLDAGGGTNIASALDVAIDLIQKGVNWEIDSNKTENKTATATDDATTSSTTEVASEATELENKLEPIIIFLTDGDPTVGETDPTRIINRLTEKNVIKKKATIFSLAFGEDADRKFLRELSLRNDGFMRHIYEAADAALQLQDFYRSVSSPLLTDVKFLYPKAQIKGQTLTKNKFRTFYAGSETIVAGQLEGDVTELEPQVLGFCGVQDGVGRKRYEISPKITLVRESKQYLPLERLWAYLSIKQLLDEKEIVKNSETSEERKKELTSRALAIALKYEFVTPLTSLVVVKPNDTKAVNAESVDDNHENTFGMAGSRMFLSGKNSGLRSAYQLSANSYPLLAAQYHSIQAPAIALDSVMRGPGGAVPLAAFGIGGAYASPGLPGPPALPSYDVTGIALSNVPTFAEYDYEESANLGPLSESVDIRVESFQHPSTTSDPLEPLTPYSLKEFPWALPLLDVASDSLLLQVNGTQVQLKLTKDDTAVPKVPGVECSSAAGGGPGRCVYLPRCAPARSLSSALYETAYCVYDNGYAGVCCPEHKNDHQDV